MYVIFSSFLYKQAAYVIRYAFPYRGDTLVDDLL